MQLRWRCCPDLVQIRMRCLRPFLEGLLLSSPPPLPPAGSGTGAKGLERELISSSLSVLLLRGAYRPLTDLGKCSSDEGAQGTPHSCAALAPMLVEKHRSI